VEEREHRELGLEEGKMSRAQDLGSISTRLRKIARLSREHREGPLVSLHHFVDEYWLREAYSRTRKDGAAGVDGKSGADYAEQVDENLAPHRFVWAVWTPSG